MTPTISDIARMTGLSKSTVSRALNDSPLISAETKERVRKMADEQGFEPNAAAQQLSLQRSNVIALLTPPYKSDTGMPDAFMLELMGGITDGLVSNGYDLLVARVHPDDRDWVRRYYDSGRVDGFIATAATCKPGLLKKLAETGAPLIVWGALRNQRWTVPVGAMLALPALWYGSLSMLLGVIPLTTREERSHAWARVRAAVLAPFGRPASTG